MVHKHRASLPTAAAVSLCSTSASYCLLAITLCTCIFLDPLHLVSDVKSHLYFILCSASVLFTCYFGLVVVLCLSTRYRHLNTTSVYCATFATWQFNTMEQIQTLYGGQDSQSVALCSRIHADYGDLEGYLRAALDCIGPLNAAPE